jgi:sialic acid synthase SpsE
VAACDIPKGIKVTQEMIEIKRPGYGIPVKEMNLVAGRMAKRDIEEDEILDWAMF